MYKQIKNIVSLVLMVFLVTFSFITTSENAHAAQNNSIQTKSVSDEIIIKTNLKDQSITKAEKLTFDLWAKDIDGNKIDTSNITVTNNGKSVDVNWDDLEKTSYTLQLEIGINNIVIQVEENGIVNSKSYTLTREEAEDGDVIGTFTFSLEAFTVGLGYIIEPIQVDLIKGYNAAQQLDEILAEYGYNYNYSGSLESGFYLSSILDGDNQVYKTTPVIPEVLKDTLAGNYDESSYDESYGLGEFDFNYMSGWMYAINNSFPNVGFSDAYLQDGDVMRVQFTLAYGMDIGGASAMGGGISDFFDNVNKDDLTKKIAEINSKNDKEEYLSEKGHQQAYDEGIEILQKIDATQEEVDEALLILQSIE